MKNPIQSQRWRLWRILETPGDPGVAPPFAGQVWRGDPPQKSTQKAQKVGADLHESMENHGKWRLNQQKWNFSWDFQMIYDS